MTTPKKSSCVSPLAFLALGFTFWMAPFASLRGDDSFFESQIRPLFVEKCIRCHGPEKQSGGVRLDSHQALKTGGKKGPGLNFKDPTNSRILKVVRKDNDVKAMPPDEDLSPKEIQAMETWIKMGAVWPSQTVTLPGKKHWAFELPSKKFPLSSGNPVDYWVDKKLASKGIKPLETASRHVLLRRMAFDLIGLSPTMEEQERFSSLAEATWFNQALEYYLAHPGYGVRWGRMWLDVVRYADTAGETADFPIPQAWRYRNWVIKAFREDTPYSLFLQKQIAGDILAQKTGLSQTEVEDWTTATGYWAISRRFGFDVLDDHYLTLEDAIDTLGKSVLGLGLACARCHDHKYDPITNHDYYAIYGILESTRFPMPGCEKRKTPKDLIRVNGKEIKEQIIDQESRLEKLRKESAEYTNDWTRLLSKNQPISRAVMPNRGDVSLPEIREISVAKGDLLLVSFLPGQNHGADSTLVELKASLLGQSGLRVWDATKDLLQAASQNQEIPKSGWIPLDLQSFPKRMDSFRKNAINTPGLGVWTAGVDVPSVFVNTNSTPISFITVKQPKSSLGVHPGVGGPVGIALPILESGRISVECRLADMDQGGTDGVIGEIRILRAGLSDLEQFEKSSAEITKLSKSLDVLKNSSPLLYAVSDGDPHDAQLQKRGNPKDRGNPVPRQNLSLLGSQKLVNPKQSGRAELASWLTDSTNPLTYRVFVNRIWQAHFGNGIVRTPNDFGLRGELPSHPELLDTLVAQFLEDGGSTKSLHRVILGSKAWQRSSFAPADLVDMDPENRWLGRFSRLRLSAEEIRDTLLLTSGDLDSTDGESHPFPIQESWGFTQHGPFRANYDHKKRSAFLMVQRIQRHPFLGLFDGADPNSSTGTRQLTTAPPQALWYLNNPFVEDCAKSLVAKLPLESPKARMQRLCKILLAREASPEDLADAPNKMDASEWVGLVRVIMSSNEFIYRD